MTCINSFTKCLYNYHRISPLVGKGSLYKINNFLNDYYEYNEGDWFKYFSIRTNGIYKHSISIKDNLAIELINIPEKTTYYNTNKGNSAFLVLKGKINKYYINNDFEIKKMFKSGSIGNIYNSETYVINSYENSLLLLINNTNNNISNVDEIKNSNYKINPYIYKNGCSGLSYLKKGYHTHSNIKIKKNINYVSDKLIDINDDGYYC